MSKTIQDVITRMSHSHATMFCSAFEHFCVVYIVYGWRMRSHGYSMCAFNTIIVYVGFIINIAQRQSFIILNIFLFFIICSTGKEQTRECTTFLLFRESKMIFFAYGFIQFGVPFKFGYFFFRLFKEHLDVCVYMYMFIVRMQ